MSEQITEVSPLKDIRLVQATDPQAVAVARAQYGDADGLRNFASETLAILNDNGLQDEAVGVVGIEHMPVPFYEALHHGLESRFQRIRDIVADLRAIKSSAEIATMRKSARLSDLGFETMLEVARPGMRGVEIVAQMEQAVRREGADHAKYWMASGPPDDWANTRLDLKPHLRILEEGDLMASCSYVLYRGYWCHGHRTGTLGRRSPELDRICAIAREAQDAGLEHLKAGQPVQAVVQAIRARAAEDGFAMHGGRVGHGMGMDYSEQPALNENDDVLLQPGMTAVIHSSFTLPDSGKFFVPLGDVCHVTADGPELLMGFPRTPFLAGR
jgi:Xaa-Pro dipeptidase